jgi:hypothetical protein
MPDTTSCPLGLEIRRDPRDRSYVVVHSASALVVVGGFRARSDARAAARGLGFVDWRRRIEEIPPLARRAVLARLGRYRSGWTEIRIKNLTQVT